MQRVYHVHVLERASKVDLRGGYIYLEPKLELNTWFFLIKAEVIWVLGIVTRMDSIGTNPME